jgi:imidazolonepropionase-like amidohydrolase
MRCVRQRIGLAIAIAILTAVYPAGAQDTSLVLVLRGGTVIDGTGAPPRKDMLVVIRADAIEAIDANAKVPEGAREIDARGKFIIPGFVDSRVRIGPTPGNHISRKEVGIEQRLASLRALLTVGVTTARLIQGSLIEQELYQRWAQDDLLPSPKIVTSGPVFTAKAGHPIEEYSVLAVNTRDRETRQIADEDQAREKAREVTHADANSLEIVYDKGPANDTKPVLEKSVLEVLVAEGHGFDLPVFCSVGWNQEAAEATGSGANAIEGAWEETLTDETLRLMAEKQVFFVPALTQQGDLLNLLDEPALKAYLAEPIVQNSLSGVMKEGLSSGSGMIQLVREKLKGVPGQAIRKRLEEQQKRAFENVRRARAAGIKIAVGTGSGTLLVFPGAAVHRELQLLVKAGLTPMEAIVAATRNTAISLGHGDEFGTLEPGKRADLLILDADPLEDIRNTQKIQTVIQNGREVKD